MKILTLATFDCFHRGHIRFLKKCLSLGETVIGLNTDEFIEKYKGKPPIMTYAERLEDIKESFPDIAIYPNSQDDGTILDVVDLVMPDMIVVGSDWLRKDYLKQVGLTPQDLDDRDISLCFVNYTWEISTTEIKRRICQLA